MLNGTVHPDYADVAASLIRQIPRQQHAGAAVCVYHRGAQVVDIWGGTRDDVGSPWQHDTVAPSFSTTKGIVATLAHILVDRGLAHYDDPIAKHWPEFGARGKQTITIRQALCHEAGLHRIGDMIGSPTEMLDWDHMKRCVADAAPAYEPGTANAYHALTFGWLLGGVIEAITGKRLAAVLHEELVDPLALDGAFIGLPHNELYRRAKLARGQIGQPARKPRWAEDLRDAGKFLLIKAGIDADEIRAALWPFEQSFDWNDEDTAMAPIPAANGHFTARSLARVYAMIAGGGMLNGTRLLSEDAVRTMGIVQNRRRDRVIPIDMRWRLGYHRVFSLGASAPEAFGHYGYGGSGAFADPRRDLAVALVANSGSGSPVGDLRMVRIARAAMLAVDRLR